MTNLLLLSAILLHAPQVQAQESWVLAEEPHVRLSSEDMPEEADLFRIRGGTVLPDGRIVVAQLGEVLQFSPGEGSAIALGGEGEGPGEEDHLGSGRGGDRRGL